MTSLKTPSKTTLRTYKIGIYGRSGSGKTCLLTSLALGGGVSPEQSTCDLIRSYDDLAPLKDPTTDQSRRDEFDRGLKWIDESIRNLKNAELPPPTPPSIGKLRFIFDFSSPDMPTRRVELIDYAGELFIPGATAESMAGVLMKHLKDNDGVVVIQDAPRPGEEAITTDALTQFRQAFAELKGGQAAHGQFTCPVALVFTKWDRRSGDAPPTKNERSIQLRTMLSEFPTAHFCGLRDSVQNSVIKPLDNDSDPLFEMFAVSALGPCRPPVVSTSGAERPSSPVPTGAFGVHDPFLWLLKRHDQSKLAKFESKLSGIWPFLGGAFGFGAFLRIKRELPTYRDPKQVATAKRIRTKSLAIATFQSFAIIALCFLLEWAWDSRQIRTFNNILADKGQLKYWDQAQRWFDAYSTSSGGRHVLARNLVFSRAEAQVCLTKSHEEWDDIHWAPVAANAPNVIEQFGDAEKYLNAFEGKGRQGRRHAEATKIAGDAPWHRAWNDIVGANDIQKVDKIAELQKKEGFDNCPIREKVIAEGQRLERSARRQENEVAILMLEQRFEATMAKGADADIVELDVLKDEVSRLPMHPGMEDERQELRRIKLTRDIQDARVGRLLAEGEKAEWARF